MDSPPLVPGIGEAFSALDPKQLPAIDLSLDEAGMIMRYTEEEPRPKRKRSSPPLPGTTKFCAHRRPCYINTLRGLLKGFTVGYSVKAGLALLSSILFRRLFKNPVATLKEVFGLDAVRVGLFMGGFTGGYRGLLCLLRRLRGKEDRWNAFIAGALAGSSLLFDVKSRRKTIAMYLFVRSVAFFYDSLVNRKKVKDVKYRSEVLFCLVSGMVMYAWHMHPKSVPKSYHKFISRHGDIDPVWLTSVRDIVVGKPVDISDWCQRAGIPNLTDKHPAILPCSVAHPQYASCYSNGFSRFFRGWITALPVYMPVHFIPLLLFRYKTLASDPSNVLLKTLLGVWKSTTFLTAFQSIFWVTWCTIRKIRGVDTGWATFVSGWVSGLSIFLEKDSRREELMLFCWPRVIESYWDVLKHYGYIKSLPKGEVGLFMIGMGLIMSVYQNDPDSIKPTYYKLLNRVVRTN